MGIKIGICQNCLRKRPLTRNYCGTCYQRLLNDGKIQKLPIAPLPEQLSEEQKEILIGSLLGDGGFYVHSSNPVFYINRKLKDKKYLDFQYSFFKDFCKSSIKQYAVHDLRTDKTYYGCRLATRGVPIFGSFFTEWYPRKEKIIPHSFTKATLTPLVCAIWFCDDGCVTVDKRGKGRLRLKLSTHGFPHDSTIKLKSILQDKFQEYFSVTGEGAIIASDAGAKEFIKYIDAHIPTSMNRKRTWEKETLNASKSLCRTKNRVRIDFSNIEQMILTHLRKQSLGPTELTQILNTKGGTIGGYLTKFFKMGWVDKTGTSHSYKDPIKYKLTKTGNTILTKYETISKHTIS